MRTLPLPLLASLLFFVVACPDGGGGSADAGTSPGEDGGGVDPDGGGTDAGTGDAGDTDGGTPPASCEDPGVDACLSNVDCGSAEVCTIDSTDSNLRCCLSGTPGPGLAGEPCTSPMECAIGRCIARDDGQAFCSGECVIDLDCPTRMTCSDIFHWCVPMDTTVPPQSCDELSLDPCFYNDNCTVSTRCEDVGGPTSELLCCTVGSQGTKAVGESCAAHTECAFGRCLGGLCSELCDFVADPCPPATMICNTIRGLCEPL